MKIDSNDFNIAPHKGTESIHFGQNRTEVETILGSPIDRKATLYGFVDYFGAGGEVVVEYDQEERCVCIDIKRPCKAVLFGRDLLNLSYNEVRNAFAHKDPAAWEVDYSIFLPSFGLNVICFQKEENPAALIDIVSIGTWRMAHLRHPRELRPSDAIKFEIGYPPEVTRFPFGRKKEEIRKALGVPFTSTDTQDIYNIGGPTGAIHIDYNLSGGLKGLRIFYPNQAVLHGTDLLQMSYRVAQEYLRQYDADASFHGLYFRAPKFGIEFHSPTGESEPNIPLDAVYLNLEPSQTSGAERQTE